MNAFLSDALLAFWGGLILFLLLAGMGFDVRLTSACVYTMIFGIYAARLQLCLRKALARKPRPN